MNDAIKEKLKNQAKAVYDATLRFENSKTKLETFDAHSRLAARNTGAKLTENDVEAMVAVTPDRGVLTTPMNEARAELEAVKKDTECLLALASLACAEVAANSRISQ